MSYTIPSLEGLKERVARIRGRVAQLERRKTKLHNEIRDHRAEEERLGLIVDFFRTLIDDELADSVSAVEGLLTEGLRAVFDDQDITVKADVAILRGKVSLNLLTRQKHPDGTITEGLSKDSFGGSVTTIQSLLLRLIVMLKRGLRPVLLLDESLAAFDPEYAEKLGEFLNVLCERLGVDILMVTHNQTLFDTAQKAYKIRKTRNNGSVFDVVR